MIKAILLDFNGVIIDDERLHLAAYQDVFAAQDITLTEADYYDSLGMDDTTFVRAAYQRANKELSQETLQTVLERKHKAYRELVAEEIPFFPGVTNFVKMMRHDYKLGIVSMARREDILATLERGDIHDAFATVVSAEDVTECKPNPMCYDTGFRRLDKIITEVSGFPMLREECVAIEDAPPGVRAAKAAGLWVLAVTNTVSAEELRRAGADVVTPRLSDWIPETVYGVFR